MNKILCVILMTGGLLTVTSTFAETNHLQKPQSLMLNNAQTDSVAEERINFFEIAKNQSSENKIQRQEHAIKMREDAINTAKMNQFKQSTYDVKKDDQRTVNETDQQQNKAD